MDDLWCRHLLCSSSFSIYWKTDRIEEGLGDHVVMKLMKPYFGTGLNVTTDNFFTNLSTAKNLKKHKITMAGTVAQNRKEIPEEIKLDKKDELYTWRFLFSASENITMCSYKAKNIKNVYLLSFMHNVERVEDEDPKKFKQFYFKMKPKGALTQLMKS